MSEHKPVPNCPIATTIERIGGKQKVVILWLLIENGVLRFGQFQRLIPGIIKRMLTKQLRQLEDDGLITRKNVPRSAAKVEYRVSKEGRTLKEVLLTIDKWGANYIKKHKL